MVAEELLLMCSLEVNPSGAQKGGPVNLGVNLGVPACKAQAPVHSLNRPPRTTSHCGKCNGQKGQILD